LGGILGLFFLVVGDVYLVGGDVFLGGGDFFLVGGFRGDMLSINIVLGGDFLTSE
jgi:hypothetical protein